MRPALIYGGEKAGDFHSAGIAGSFATRDEDADLPSLSSDRE